ncbi:MAG: hypothetical protein WAW13_01380 [Minisyncoccia bacterium]
MTQLASNANEKIKLILVKILEEYDLGDGIDDIRIDSENFLVETGIDQNQFTRILSNLEKNYVIDSFSSNGTNYSITPLSHFRSRAEDYIQRLGVPSLKQTPGSILYLKGGDLWHGDKEDFCYPMSATKDRLAMVKFMTENNGYQTTKSIASALGKTEQNVRTEIAKIKAKIKHHLGIDDLIESSKGQGYRINPKYKITIIK